MPARFVALRSEDGSSRPTFIIEMRGMLEAETRRLFEESLFAVVNGRRSFLAAAWDSTRHVLRYDPTCMKPATRAAARASVVIERLIHEARPIRVDWGPRTTLIIDNWRCLHARGSTTTSDVGVRQLTRALLETGA